MAVVSVVVVVVLLNKKPEQRRGAVTAPKVAHMANDVADVSPSPEAAEQLRMRK